MKVIVVGGYGTIGQQIVSHLAKKHEIVVAGRTKGDVLVDISNSQSIKSMYENTGSVDAIVNVSGEAKWALFEELSEEDFYIGLKSKLMGQVNLVRLGVDYLNEGGSFTLTTGILADDPVMMTTSAAMVNGAIHSFVKAAALELSRGQRINVVSPGLVEGSVDKYADYFPGHNPIPWAKVINGFVRSIEGKNTGEIIRIYDNA